MMVPLQNSTISLLSLGRLPPPSFPPHILSQLFITCQCLFARPVQSTTMCICLLLLPNPPFPLPQPPPFTSTHPAPCSLHQDLRPAPHFPSQTPCLPFPLTRAFVTNTSLQLILVQPNMIRTLRRMCRRWQDRMGAVIRREEASRHQKMLGSAGGHVREMKEGKQRR